MDLVRLISLRLNLFKLEPRGKSNSSIATSTAEQTSCSNKSCRTNFQMLWAHQIQGTFLGPAKKIQLKFHLNFLTNLKLNVSKWCSSLLKTTTYRWEIIHRIHLGKCLPSWQLLETKIHHLSGKVIKESDLVT